MATINPPLTSATFFFFLEGRLGIINPLMVDADQYLIETFGDLMEVLEGQFTLVQLTVYEDVINYLLHHSLDTRRCRIGQGP